MLKSEKTDNLLRENTNLLFKNYFYEKFHIARIPGSETKAT